MSFRTIATVGTILAASAALAHSGVKDPNVMARMKLMGEVKANMGVLGGMAKGKMAFDADKAAMAKAGLIANAQAIPAAFEVKVMDPKSEALPAIWENWEDFASKAGAMEAAVGALDVSSAEGIQGGLRSVGGSCGGCHKSYRIDK
jgi:cytochrome c556